MGFSHSRLHDPLDVYVGDKVYNRHGPMFHGPIPYIHSCCPYCKTFYYAYGYLPEWTCYEHTYPDINGGA